RNIGDVEKAIERTIQDHNPRKAKPFLPGTKLEALKAKDQKMVLLWALSGLRGDSIAAVDDTDISKKGDVWRIHISEDKIRKQRGRIIEIHCNCDTNAKTVGARNRFCPMHGEGAVMRSDFPLGKARISSLAKGISGTLHSCRRRLALATRREWEQGKISVKEDEFLTHMGWEQSSKMWDEYTADHKTWEASEFIPLHGLRRRWPSGGGPPPRVFVQPKAVQEDTLVKRTIKITPKQKLQKKG
ncbi:unnamed protein product, partial [Amoebophrya sp. A25]